MNAQVHLLFVLQSFSLRREFAHTHANKEGRNVYFTLSFAGVALLAAIFVGVAVAKWRTARSPHAQGFIEVDQVCKCGGEMWIVKSGGVMLCLLYSENWQHSS